MSFKEQAPEVSDMLRQQIPRLVLWLCRIGCFVWAYAFHDWQSLVLLSWVITSVLVDSLHIIIKVTLKAFLPAFCLFFFFYYIVNIPGLIPSYIIQDRSYEDYGFTVFNFGFLEIGLMFLVLFFFALLIKSRSYLAVSEAEEKRQLFIKMSDPKSGSMWHSLFFILRRVDLVVCLVIFFVGVTKIDFFHISLMYIFVIFCLFPDGVRRNFIFVLAYICFFVFEK